MSQTYAADEGALEGLLAGYAAGTLARPVHALIGAHLEIRYENRSYVNALEAMKGDALENGEVAGLLNAEAMLARIMQKQRHTEIGDETGKPHGDLPTSLGCYIGSDVGALNWRWTLPGLRSARLADDEGYEVSLLRIRGGARMPHHTHEGDELTLVLKGAFRDETGLYGRGDIAIGDDDLDHRPIAEPGEECLCFVVNSAPLRLTGPFGRWLSRLSGH